MGKVVVLKVQGGKLVTEEESYTTSKDTEMKKVYETRDT